jgi:hypothetical protein
VKKVTRPPRISVPIVDPRSEILKNRSTAFFGAGGADTEDPVEVEDMAAVWQNREGPDAAVREM